MKMDNILSILVMAKILLLSPVFLHIILFLLVNRTYKIGLSKGFVKRPLIQVQLLLDKGHGDLVFPEAEFLDVMGTKVLRVFLLVSHRQLY
jgi:hypothetical protein